LPSAADAGTVLGLPAGEAGTVLGPPADEARTMLGVPGDDAGTRLGLPADEAGTMLGVPGEEAGTMLGLPGGEARTMLGVPAGEAGTVPPPAADEARTMLGVPSPGGTPTGAGVHSPVHGHATTGAVVSRPISRPADSTGPLGVGQQFSARYIIVKLLGIGGMGAVYQAWDGELSVMVALKVIRPEVTRDPAAARDIERRFKQELLLARQVTHKNVVRIHDLGEIDGIKYITMPYLEGEDLASVLKQAGRLPVTRVMSIARQIATGMLAAHEAGVVHRDLKPANVMIAKEQAKDQPKDQAIIMDFGIARTSGGPSPAAVSPAQLKAALDDGATRIAPTTPAGTVAGAIVGTVEYMAPEQARGQAVDQRADIYAFGLILYDMLTGRRRAERAQSAIEELQGRLEQPPPAIRTVVPEVPEPVERLVSRCVEPDAAKRYQTTAELVEAIERLDDNGKLRPIKRVVGAKLAAAIVVALLGLSGYIWWYTRPPVVHDPVSVLIADFANTTGDAAFDGLEAPMARALETADFIMPLDRAGFRRATGARLPDTLDEPTAQGIAVKQGLPVVLSGTVSSDGRGYKLTVRAIRSVTNEVIVEAENRAADKDGVVGAVTALATRVRRALGDDESDSAQRFAMDTLSATSLEVVREYAAAMDALSRSQNAEALKGFSKAVDLDPKFGLAYAGMAIASRNLDKQEDAETYARESLNHLDGMTPRERLRTRGLFFFVTSNYPSCVKEYSDLVARYAADAAARNNLALCSTYLRDWPQALSQMRAVVKILPGRALYRENLATYLSYSSDFQAGETEARAIQNPGLFGLLALAFAQIGQGQLAQAEETYRLAGAIDAQGASYMASGLADLAIYEGRFSEAERILIAGAEADVKSQDTERAATKYAALGYARVQQRKMAQAVAAAADALKASESVKIQFLAARIFLEAGEPARAGELAARLGKQLLAEPRAYAKIIDAGIARRAADLNKAITLMTEANALFETWIGRFDLGRLYLDVAIATKDLGFYTQADSEFDRCINRRGESLALFLDEEPTSGYFPPVLYYRARARQGVNPDGPSEAYAAYLAIRGNSKEDPLAQEARKHVGK
jgi:serine/threonine protein kinase